MIKTVVLQEISESEIENKLKLLMNTDIYKHNVARIKKLNAHNRSEEYLKKLVDEILAI
jgi:hypothetical protein